MDATAPDAEQRREHPASGHPAAQPRPGELAAVDAEQPADLDAAAWHLLPEPTEQPKRLRQEALRPPAEH